MKAEHFSYKLSIQALSPLHIGSGESLSSVGEYFASDHRVIFLDNTALMRHLDDINKLETYVDLIKDKGINFNFYSTLKESPINVDPINFEKRSVPFNKGTTSLVDKNNELKLCIKTNEEAYIPGSSLKGLVSNAIIYKYLKDHSQKRTELNNMIEDCLKEKNDLGKKDIIRKINNKWKDIEANIFQTNFPKKNKDVQFFNIANIMRFSDSTTVPNGHLVVEQVIRQHFYGENTDGLDWLCECIRPHEATTLKSDFTLYLKSGIDLGYFNFLKDNAPSKLFSMLNEFHQDTILAEIQMLNAKTVTHNMTLRDEVVKELNSYLHLIDRSKNKYAIARAGQGKTIFFQTILPLLNPELQTELISFLFTKQKSVSEDEIQIPFLVVPRTRSLTASDHKTTCTCEWSGNNEKGQEIVCKSDNILCAYRMLGWVKLERFVPTNIVDEVVNQKTVIKAIVTDTKKVEFKLNGTTYSNIQLVLPHRGIEINIGKPINVLVWAISKNGIINQVKFLL